MTYKFNEQTAENKSLSISSAMVLQSLTGKKIFEAKAVNNLDYKGTPRNGIAIKIENYPQEIGFYSWEVALYFIQEYDNEGKMKFTELTDTFHQKAKELLLAQSKAQEAMTALAAILVNKVINPYIYTGKNHTNGNFYMAAVLCVK